MSRRRAQLNLQLALEQALATQQEEQKHFEDYYQDLVARYYAAQVDYHEAARQCAHLRTVVRAK